MTKHNDPCPFLCLKGSSYLVMIQIGERLHKKTQAAAGKQLWKLFLCHFKMAVSHLKLPVTMVIGTSDQDRGARVKQARVTALRHFGVSGIIFFRYHIENFCHYYFKVSTLLANTKDLGITGSVYQTRQMEIHASGLQAPGTPIIWIMKHQLVQVTFAS